MIELKKGRTTVQAVFASFLVPMLSYVAFRINTCNHVPEVDLGTESGVFTVEIMLICVM